MGTVKTVKPAKSMRTAKPSSAVGAVRTSKSVAAAAAAPTLPATLELENVQRLIDASSDVALVLDAQGRILDLRARDRDIAKLSRRAWRGRLWVDVVTVESREKVSELLAAALADGPAGPKQVNHPEADAPDLPVLYTAVRLSDPPRGKASGAEAEPRILAFGIDLRETVALQRRLVDAQQTMERDYWRFREAETRYRHLFQAAPDAVLVVDAASLRIVEANPAATSLLEQARLEPQGAALSSLFRAGAAGPLTAAITSARNAGRHDRLVAALAMGPTVSVAIQSFREQQASLLLVRLAPEATDAASGHARVGAGRAVNGVARPDALEAAYVRHSVDALAFTDRSGRVLTVNGAFTRLTQLASEDQARGHTLDRWLGRTGVELSVLLANLREGGSTGLFATDVRGAQGLVSEAEITASVLPEGSGAAYAFTLRDVGRRLTPRDAPNPVEGGLASVKQLTELVGRVPLKQIVAETSDMIEKLSIQAALEMTKDNRAMAAQLLGLSRQSLYVKLRRFGMPIGDDER